MESHQSNLGPSPSATFAKCHTRARRRHWLTRYACTCVKYLDNVSGSCFGGPSYVAHVTHAVALPAFATTPMMGFFQGARILCRAFPSFLNREYLTRPARELGELCQHGETLYWSFYPSKAKTLKIREHVTSRSH